MAMGAEGAEHRSQAVLLSSDAPLRQVLRFHAFFRETVPESPSENARVRR